MTEHSVQFAKRLSALSPALNLMLEEHVRDFDELLPHLFLGDVVRHLIGLTRSGSSRTSLDEVRAILVEVEASYAKGIPEVQELIAASFLENLPTEQEEGAEIRAMLGPELRMRLKRMT